MDIEKKKKELLNSKKEIKEKSNKYKEQYNNFLNYDYFDNLKRPIVIKYIKGTKRNYELLRSMSKGGECY